MNGVTHLNSSIGSYSVAWEGQDNPSEGYGARLEIRGFIFIAKLIFIRYQKPGSPHCRDCKRHWRYGRADD